MVTARDVVGVVGNVISFGLFLSPCPTFYGIIKKKSTEDFSPNPYLCTILNCMLWVYYGLPFVRPHSILVVTINGIGLGIEFIYVCIFLIYANKTSKFGRGYVLLVFAAEVAFCALVLLLLTYVPFLVRNRPMLTGVLCDIVNILMYGMPLDNLVQVIKTKSSRYMPKWLLLFNALNGGCWLTFALLRLDIYILISNGLGFVLGIIQIIVWFKYRNGPEKDQEVPKIDDASLRAKELAMV
ncbi:hypothetical protein MKW92_022452 [Papaver armeniacum]|nr:hypothetical protein MKW92_032679 [Papaver armeniacum]KAI3900656.1 hypothetical protein MKW92_022452 [Papaver armeniacum]